ncbi:MAG: BON domain-containing protein [bacterium]
MAHDYEDLHDIDGLSDAELRDLVQEQLGEQASLDITDIVVHAKSGLVTLTGSVNTDEERRIATHVLTDTLGIERYSVDLVLDPMRGSADSSGFHDREDEDGLDSDGRSLDVEVALDGIPLDRASQIAADLEGTSDYESVMENGVSWNPPDSPTPEGLGGADAGPEEVGGRH